MYIEGRLETRSWQDKNGNKRYVTEVITNRMQMLEAKGQVKATEQAPPPEEVFVEKELPQGEGIKESESEEEIPF